MNDFANHTDARIRKAFETARAAHAGQVDKGGVNYINHPLTVANSVGNDVSAIIVALLHDVAQIKSNELAAKIKAADLKHNSDLSRLANPTAKDLVRVEKYRLALEILEGTT